MKSVKEQTNNALTDVHTLTIENITEMSRKIEVIRDSVAQRQGLIEQSIMDIRQRADQWEEDTFRHSKNINETLHKELQRMEKIASAVEKYTLSQLQEM